MRDREDQHGAEEPAIPEEHRQRNKQREHHDHKPGNRHQRVDGGRAEQGQDEQRQAVEAVTGPDAPERVERDRDEEQRDEEVIGVPLSEVGTGKRRGQRGPIRICPKPVEPSQVELLERGGDGIPRHRLEASPLLLRLDRNQGIAPDRLEEREVEERTEGDTCHLNAQMEPRPRIPAVALHEQEAERDDDQHPGVARQRGQEAECRRTAPAISPATVDRRDGEQQKERFRIHRR